MKNTSRIAKVLFAVVPVIALLLSPGASFAQSVSGSTTASTGVTQPGVISTFQGDDIIQLNNLRITGISSTQAPAIITAETSGAVVCQQFATQQNSEPLPCSVGLGRPYTIQVNASTILLLKNRTRASLGQFGVGDTINVYGFRDADTNTIEALIMRDLSKPVVSRFVQLEQVTVLAVYYPPLATGALPQLQLVVGFQLNRCYDFGAAGTKRAIMCPLAASDAAKSAAAPTQAPQLNAQYPAFMGKQYVVSVTANTSIVNANRVPIPMSSLTQGDVLNIYGTMQGDSGTVNASVVRRLSGTVIPPDSLSLSLGSAVGQLAVGETGSWTVNVDTPIGTGVTFSAGATWGDSVVVNPPTDGSQGSTSPFLRIVGPSVTFTHSYSSSGTYPVTFTVSDSLGRTGQIRTTVTVGGDVHPALTVVSPNGGETWQSGSQQTILWKADASIAAVDIYLDTNYIRCITAPCPAMPTRTYAIARNVPNTGSYSWNVAYSGGSPTTAYSPVPEGAYYIEVQATNGGMFDESDNAFTVTSKPATRGLEVSTKTDKSTYRTGEPITLTINGYNNSSQAQSFEFGGCQTSYTIQSVGSDFIGPVLYDQNTMRACPQYLMYVTIPAYGSKTWTVVHQPDTYYLKTGTYLFTGNLLGYGSASAYVTVQ